MSDHSTTLTLAQAAAICHGPSRRVPRGHEPCSRCTGYGPLYETLPHCRACGDAVCASCAVAASVVPAQGEDAGSCLCLMCEAAGAEATCGHCHQSLDGLPGPTTCWRCEQDADLGLDPRDDGGVL